VRKKPYGSNCGFWVCFLCVCWEQIPGSGEIGRNSGSLSGYIQGKASIQRLIWLGLRFVMDFISGRDYQRSLSSKKSREFLMRIGTRFAQQSISQRTEEFEREFRHSASSSILLWHSGNIRSIYEALNPWPWELLKNPKENLIGRSISRPAAPPPPPPPGIATRTRQRKDQ